MARDIGLLCGTTMQDSGDYKCVPEVCELDPREQCGDSEDGPYPNCICKGNYVCTDVVCSELCFCILLVAAERLNGLAAGSGRSVLAAGNSSGQQRLLLGSDLVSHRRSKMHDQALDSRLLYFDCAEFGR